MSLTAAEIKQYLDQLEKEAKALQEESVRFCWHMRGGLTLDASAYLTQNHRDFMRKLIKENIEATKKTGLPVF